MRTRYGFGFAVALLALGACGGGSGGSGGPVLPGSAPNLTGWWLEEVDDMDAPDGYTGNRLVFLDDDGSTVAFDNALLVKEGWVLRADDPDGSSPTRWEWRFEIVSDTNVEGHEEYLVDGERGYGRHLRLTRTSPPDGFMAMSGTIRGGTVDVDTTTAFAAEYDDHGYYTILSLYDGSAAEGTWIWFTHETTPPIPAGSYPVGGDDDDISVIAYRDGRSEYGDTGIVTLIESSSTRAAGWFEVDLVDGGSIVGTFDVPVRVTATWD